jgi:hypothetical protein
MQFNIMNLTNFNYSYFYLINTYFEFLRDFILCNISSLATKDEQSQIKTLSILIG